MSQLVKGGDAAGGDDGDAYGPEHPREGGEVGAFLGAVAGDVGVDEAGDAQLDEAGHQLFGPLLGALPPALDGDLAAAGVHGDDDGAGGAIAGLGDKGLGAGGGGAQGPPPAA